MTNHPLRCRAAICFAVASATVCVVVQPVPAQTAATHDCAAVEASDFPKAVISNGNVKAVVYLPDAARGYYRATRFDWSGVIGCLAANGHTYFGQWFPHYDPLANDSISGPVEEFKGQDGALNYAEAKVGEPFVKVGVGVLRKVNDKPYSSYVTYPIIDRGTWKVHTSRSSVSFTQRLQSASGVAYIYRKDMELDKREPVLLLKHTLKNVSSKPLELDVYDHDFFMLDGAPTGPNMVVHFPFQPVPEHPLPNGGQISGNDLVYTSELQAKQTVNSFLSGYSNKVSDYDFTVEDQLTHVGVEQTSDKPLSHLNFWSIRTTICPEGYIHLSISPGETVAWKLRYRFFSQGTSQR